MKTTDKTKRPQKISARQFVLRIIRLLVVAALIIVLSQDIQIFPGALTALLGDSSLGWPLPEDVESQMISTSDGEQLELWRLPVSADQLPSAQVAIVFHGNGGNLRHFFSIQSWFKSQGITSYGFDYRGFGKSSGWPSEQGIYRDAQAVWQYVSHREKIGPEQLIVFGLSIGCGPAAEAARTLAAKTLVLVSPYESMAKVVSDRAYLKFLTPFLWYDFPTAENVSKLTQTCLVVAHGEKDTIIAPYHADGVAKSYKGSLPVEQISDPEAGHNDLFFRIQGQLAAAIAHCRASSN